MEKKLRSKIATKTKIKMNNSKTLKEYKTFKNGDVISICKGAVIEINDTPMLNEREESLSMIILRLNACKLIKDEKIEELKEEIRKLNEKT